MSGRPTEQQIADLYDWMANEWAANHDYDLPPEQFGLAVLARWGGQAAGGCVNGCNRRTPET